MGKNIPTRVAYGPTSEESGDRDNAYVFDADLKSCTMTRYFSEEYPERLFNIGIVETNMIDIAAGFATCGAASLVHIFAVLAAGRTYDQIHNGVIHPELDVKIIGGRTDLTVGEDGVSHQYIKDISLMRMIPKTTVIVPCDSHETRLTTKAVSGHGGPCYLRTGRCALDYVADDLENYKFEVGKEVQLVGGTDAITVACGLMVQESLKAEKILEAEGINVRVIDIYTIKPIDRDIIIKAAKETRAIMTTEEHNVIGGLGSSASEVTVGAESVPIEFTGVEDKFGHSGAPKELLESLGLTPEHIAVAAR